MTQFRSPLLEIHDLAVSYSTSQGKLLAIRNVSLSVDEGETVGIIGESGCGKTTLALAIMRYLDRNEQIESGRILFEENDLLGKSERQMRQIWGQKLAMVYQDPSGALNPSLTVGRQIAEILEVHESFSSQRANQKAISVLRELQISDPKIVAHSYPHQLSGGMRQRVCIAMALVTRPNLLILDEPTTNLDVTVEAKILDMVKELNTTILYITHDLGVVYEISDRVGVMYAGQFVEKAPTDKLIKAPIHPYTRGLLRTVPEISLGKQRSKLRPISGSVAELDNLPSGCKFHPRCPAVQDDCRGKQPEFTESDPSHYVRCFEIHSADQEVEVETEVVEDSSSAEVKYKPTSPALLQIHDLKKYFGDKGSWFFRGSSQQEVRAVDGVDLELSRGHILGVVGESGCGKSTLARTILGLEDLTAGSIFFKGTDISTSVQNRDWETVRQIQIVFQDPQTTLNPKRTVEQAIIRPIKMRGLNHSAALSLTKELLGVVNMGSEYLGRYPDQLSGGQKQRVAIARAFASQPDLVFCDEPTSSLDVSVQASILNLLLDLQNEQGTAYIFISHNLAVVSYISAYLAVMYLGRILEIGPTHRILTPPYHPYTEALLSSIPVPDPEIERKRIRLSGTIPSPRDVPMGCRFHTRCPRKIGKLCENDPPPDREVNEKGNHRISCHIPIEELREVEPVLKG